MSKPTPVWKMPTRDQAKEILIYSRARIEEAIVELDEEQMKRPTELGGGAWSIKDLLGHLAGYEEQAAAFAKGTKPPFDYAKYGSFDERNAADIERKQRWSLKRVWQELETRRSELLRVIEDMDDERWSAKVPTKSGKSALALVLGKLLVGGHHGLFAHDLAHITDLKRSVKALHGSRKVN